VFTKPDIQIAIHERAENGRSGTAIDYLVTNDFLVVLYQMQFMFSLLNINLL